MACLNLNKIFLTFQISKIHFSHVSYGGKPNISGLNCSIESSVNVALSIHNDLSTLGSGIQTTCIPAARAASTPLGASSNTKTYKIMTSSNESLSESEKILNLRSTPFRIKL